MCGSQPAHRGPQRLECLLTSLRRAGRQIRQLHLLRHAQRSPTANAIRPYQRLRGGHVPEHILVGPPILALQQIERARPAVTYTVAVILAV